MNLQKIKKSALLLGILALAIGFPLVTTDMYVLSLIIPGLIWSVACMGWVMIVRTGQFSMGQAAFMTIGGYASALLTTNLNMSVWLGFLFGGVFSAFSALLLGVAVLRLGGIYFAIVTLGFGEIVRVIAMNLTSVTKGVYGIIPPSPEIQIGTFTVNFVISKVPYYYLSLFLVISAGLVFWRIDQCRLGRIFRSVSSNMVLSEHLGMHLMKYRVIAFTVAGFFTGVAGAIFSHHLFFIGPTLYVLPESIMILIMSTVGGIGSAVTGPIMGALLLSVSGDYLTSLVKGAKPLVFGLLVVVIVFFLPKGLVDLKRYISQGFDYLRGKSSH